MFDTREMPTSNIRNCAACHLSMTYFKLTYGVLMRYPWRCPSSVVCVVSSNLTTADMKEII